MRAVNVGGANHVGMAGLRALVERLGFGDVRTLLQSGNVVFRGSRRAAGALEAELERAIAPEFGVRTDRLRARRRDVRAGRRTQSVSARGPQRSGPPGRTVFSKSPPSAAAVKALAAAIVGRETVGLAGGHLYIVYPDGLARSKLTNAIIEKHLGTRGTARNWNTVLKLAEMATG